MKKLFQLFVISLLLIFSFSFVLNCSNAVELTKSIDTEDTDNLKAFTEPIDYTETLDTFDNPERGFYSHLRYNFKVSGNEEPKAYRLEGNLIHLRFGIGDFSGKVNGNKDLELSQDMLNMLDTILKKIKANGGTVIVRFAYDNFDGDENLEPSLDMILRHIEQICPILTENKDVISYVELGFFGPWGEMHSSDISTPANVTQALNLMLANTPEEIKIGVRQPKYYVDFAGIDRSKLNENITVKGTKEYRVGLFNDGYLGSHSDLGTFENREIEISWLKNQALHTLYGGEIVSTRGNEENDKLNTAEYMSKEAFLTHTTYLNSEYDENVINAWKDEIYNGDDELYKGKDGYLYIANHMGYRFVLRNSNIINSLDDNKINLALDIENVGFANLVNSKKVSVILESDSKKFEFVTDLDPTTWNTQSTSKLNISIPIPDDFEETEYKVYLRVSKYGDYLNDNNYQCIRLANNNIWNETLGANYVGQFVYDRENKTETPDPQNPDNNPNDVPNDNPNDVPNENNPNDNNQSDNQNNTNNDPEIDNNPEIPDSNNNNNNQHSNENENNSDDNNKNDIQDNTNNDPEIDNNPEIPDLNNNNNNNNQNSNNDENNLEDTTNNNKHENSLEDTTNNKDENNLVDTNNNNKNENNLNDNKESNSKNDKFDNTVSPNNMLPYTGIPKERNILLFMIILSSISTVYFFKKQL